MVRSFSEYARIFSKKSAIYINLSSTAISILREQHRRDVGGSPHVCPAAIANRVEEMRAAVDLERGAIGNGQNRGNLAQGTQFQLYQRNSVF